MRQLLIALGIALLPTCLIAAEPLDAAPFKQWIAPDWKLIRTARGDLNHDGKNDVVLVLEKNDASNRKPNEELGARVLNLNPRRLLVLFKTDSGYELAAQSDRFLPSENNAESTCLADPLEEGGVQVSQGLLKIDLHYWLSCGGWGVSHTAWTFRYEGKRFRLIGRDTSEFARNSGEGSASSTNFLSGKQKVTTGTSEFAEESKPAKAAKPSVVWKNIPRRRAVFLDEMTSDCDRDGKTPEWCR